MPLVIVHPQRLQRRIAAGGIAPPPPPSECQTAVRRATSVIHWLSMTLGMTIRVPAQGLEPPAGSSSLSRTHQDRDHRHDGDHDTCRIVTYVIAPTKQDTELCMHQLGGSRPDGFVACWWLQFVVVVRGSGQVGGGRVRMSAMVSTVFPAG